MKPFTHIGWWIEARRYSNRNYGDDSPLGSALVSPNRSKAGLDNYRFMRKVAKGDVCLHLNEANQICGISRAAAAYKQTTYPDNSSNGMYVPLSGYFVLNPPLTFLTETYRKRLDHLRETATQYKTFFFYTKDLKRNMYLTPVTQELLDLMDEAYLETAGQKLSQIAADIKP